MSRDRKSPAGIGEFEAGRPVFILQPAAQKPGHEPVTRTKHVENVNREPFAALSLVEAVRDWAFENHCSHGATFADQCRIRYCAHGFQRLKRVCRAASNMKLFFRADDQVEQMQGRLQFGRNSCGFDKTIFAVAMTGKPQRLGR